jgi:hypothetical protein|tara:strand:- start:3625 stop:3798 length:174 start_codon:yes stop_codon:yes gene_type:complete
MTKFKSEFRKLLEETCKRDGKGRFKTVDVIKQAEKRIHFLETQIKSLTNTVEFFQRR